MRIDHFVKAILQIQNEVPNANVEIQDEDLVIVDDDGTAALMDLESEEGSWDWR